MQSMLLLKLHETIPQVCANFFRVLHEPAFSGSIVFNAAAMQTGLPPNVDACAPGFQSIKSARATHAPIGNPDPMPFAMQMMSG